MTYEEYRNAVLIAVVEAETYRRPALNLTGQIDVWRAVREADLEVKENWIRDAVQNYEALGFFCRVLRPISPDHGRMGCRPAGRVRRVPRSDRRIA